MVAFEARESRIMILQLEHVMRGSAIGYVILRLSGFLDSKLSSKTSIDGVRF